MPNWSAWALLSVLILPTCSFAADKTLNITVVADHTKANGEPWDGPWPWRGTRTDRHSHPEHQCATGLGRLRCSLGNASGMQHEI